MRLLISFIFCFFVVSGFAQPYPQGNPTTNAPQSWVSYGYTRDSAHLFIARDTFNSRYPAIVMRTDGTMWKTLGAGGFWYAIGGSVDSLLFVTHTALNDTLLNYVKIQTQNPTASLSGGSNYELHSAGTFNTSVGWSAGRLAAGTNLAATKNIISVTVASISQSLTSCATTTSLPCSFTGTQSVSFPYNTNTSFSNVVSSVDKSATATTTFNWLPNNYYGYSSLSSPDTTTILSKLGGGQTLQSSRVYAPTVTIPSGSAKYIYYAYPSSEGALTSIKDQAGNQVIGAFTQTTLTFNNASGYRQSYYIYTSNNNYSNTSIYVSYQ